MPFHQILTGGLSTTGSSCLGGVVGTSFLDLGGVFTVDFKRHLKSIGFLPNDNFDAIDDLDLRDDFDGINI